MNRNTIAAFGLLAIVVLSVFNLLLDVTALKLPDIASFDKHLSQVRRALPPTGSVGYYTDFTEAQGEQAALREYYLIQYALAPVVVEKTLDRPFVITNLHKAENKIRSPMFQVVNDYGSGIQLLRNKTK